MQTAKQLSNTDLKNHAPSIFATDKYKDRSDRYTFIPTIKIVDALRESGFYPVMAMQSKSRLPDKKEYTKHLLRFRSDDADEVLLKAKAEANAKAALTGKHAWIEKHEQPLIPELVLTNAHDGGSSYELELGLFRLVCGNGLIVSAGSFASYRVRHSGDIISDVLAASSRIISQASQLNGVVSRLAHTPLTEQQRYVFAWSALALRYGTDDKNNLLTGIAPESMLVARRPEDEGKTLWHALNVVQENMIAGGIEGMTANNRRTRTRRVAAVDSTLDINRNLWELAEEFAA